VKLVRLTLDPPRLRSTAAERNTSRMHVLEREEFDGLFGVLSRRGYTVMGPTVADGAIVYGELRSAADLPIGWTDEQDGGHYRLRRRDDEALFGYAVGPHSWKQFQLPAEVRLFRARRGEDGSLTEIDEPPREPPRYAFLGVRSCELHAMGIMDRVLTGGAHVDPADRARREDVLVIAVNCGQAGGTCFCVSMSTGPKAQDGFDLALTEVLEDGRHTSRSKPTASPAPISSPSWRRGPPERARRAPPNAPPSAPWRRWVARWTSRTSATCSTATWSIRAGTTSPNAA
jgi:hypothetical protein